MKRKTRLALAPPTPREGVPWGPRGDNLCASDPNPCPVLLLTNPASLAAGRLAREDRYAAAYQPAYFYILIYKIF